MFELFEIIKILMIRLLYSDNYYVIAAIIVLVILINIFRKKSKDKDLKNKNKEKENK